MTGDAMLYSLVTLSAAIGFLFGAISTLATMGAVLWIATRQSD